MGTITQDILVQNDWTAEKFCEDLEAGNISIPLTPGKGVWDMNKEIGVVEFVEYADVEYDNFEVEEV
jgi:hypothetical protein